MKTKNDIRDEIIEKATAIELEHRAMIWISSDGNCDATRIRLGAPQYRSDFPSIEEAYAWIMEGRE